MDISASMTESDPEDARKQIMVNILSSMDDDSSVALVVFTAKGKVINNGLSNKNVDKKILITDVFNIANTCRISLSFYNTRYEVDLLINVLKNSKNIWEEIL